ncbi:MAG: hypothetical protein CBB65_07515 [Hyphomonadaceae bacterium TMED5]|nr:hypothetical protein [Ponticaulis sp.]OUX99915.1 MAG: hypothetical protein CBB65_07515 [Hyphomonadaceae bacterium TMED5]|tara:strand:- start:252919 stop:253668 length:750 start_codon:yes stop_codon:yes gene_type:complete
MEGLSGSESLWGTTLKQVYASLFALTLCACQPTTDAPTASRPAGSPPADIPPLEVVSGYYGENWNVDELWPGEYPDGFSVEGANVILPARFEPDPSGPPDLSCPLDQSATIHQWNHDRVETDDLYFIVANQTLPQRVNTETSIQVWLVDDPEQDEILDLTPGDTVTVLRYYGEGFGEMAVDGVRYAVDLTDLYTYLEVDETPLEEHLWALITCDDDTATRAWVLFSEAMNVPGIVYWSMTGYGIASDLE